VTLAAIAFGATAVIFAIGLHYSLGQARASQTLTATVQAQIQQNNQGAGPNGAPTAAQLAVAASAMDQPGVAHSNADYQNQVTVDGFSRGVQADVFDGPSAWMGYALISGHWYNAPGEVDVNTVFLTDSGLSVGDTVTVYSGTVAAGAKPVTARIVGEVFRPSSDPHIFASAQTLPGTAVAGDLSQWNVGLKHGTTVAAYIQAVNARLGVNSVFLAVPSGHGGQFYAIASSLIGLLSLMVAIAAGLGVLNTVLMTTRDRVHDLGIFKSLGMRPGQVVVMVICWVVGPAVIAGAIAAPAAVALNTATVHAMAATAHTGIPASFTNVFPVSRLALLSLAALAIAVLGALLPAAWAARARPATALRTE
jgi:putative ABC transport system permease protein